MLYFSFEMSLNLPTSLIIFTFSGFSPLMALPVRSAAPVCSVFQIREYAARKGTREKARKKKVKVEEKKTEFIPHNQRGLEK